MTFWKWPWTQVRGARPLCKQPTVRARLALEALEDRLAPSANPWLSHHRWSQQSFSLDLVSVANQVAPDTTASVTAPVGTYASGGYGALINLDDVDANYPTLNGTGYAVAVIDTGIDYSHADLGGGWGSRVIAGWDFVNDDADPMDDNGHGTHVAGIIGSSDSLYGGVAPDVDLIALKVLDANGTGSFGDVEAALQWVVANQAKYNIVAINLSLGTGNYTSNPYTFLDDEFSTLENMGVFIAVAAGNSYAGQPGLAYPASDAYTVSVGAVWAGDFGQVSWASGAVDYTTAADRVTSFSQRSSALDIVAPGALITSTYLGNSVKTMAGTSMATPVIAGAAVIIHQALDLAGQTASANQDSILAVMQSTGKTVIDGDDENDNVANTGLSFQRLDLNAALGAIGSSPNVAPVLGPIANTTIKPGVAKTITLSATDADGDPITYTAKIVGGTGGGSSQAYQLDQQLGLNKAADDYLVNAWGQNEKWLIGSGSTYYCLMSNGDLRRWAGSMTATLGASNLIANLGVAVYDDPSLLWNAQPPSSAPNVSLTVNGNQLTMLAPAGTSGSFSVEVTASDGQLSSTKTFTVTTVGNQPPVLNTIANISLKAGASKVVTLSASDPDGDAITYSARVVSGVPVTLTLSGNKLTVKAPAGYIGSGVIEVTASDGSTTSVKTFTVSVTAALKTPRR